VLIVRIPDFQKRARIKKSFAAHYRAFKQDCIEIFLLVADGSYEGGVPETLLDQRDFKEYFKQEVSESQNRWHRFANTLNPHYLQELLNRMQVFRDEVLFVLNNTDIGDDKSFEFFKRLSGAIYSVKDTTLDYDSTRGFCGFLWSLFTGWDWVEGYPERDIIQEMIEAI
jgi:hypothetical protein